MAETFKQRIDRLASSILSQEGSLPRTRDIEGETGSRAAGVTLAKGVPEEILTLGQRKQRQVRRELGKRKASVENIGDLSIEELETLSQQGVEEERQDRPLGDILPSPFNLLKQSSRFGTDFLQDLLGQQSTGAEQPILPEPQVSEREKQLRDDAAIAISGGADPVKVNERLSALLKGG